MTQIVYDGEYLYADRKSYIDSRFVNEAPKVKAVENETHRLLYGFAGSLLECAIGEKVVESFFDPTVCEEARKRLPVDSHELFQGILVEIPHNPKGSHRVYLINYVGEKSECETGKFLSTGYLCDALAIAYRALQHFSPTKPNAEEVLRFVTSNTSQAQDGLRIDKIKI